MDRYYVRNIQSGWMDMTRNITQETSNWGGWMNGWMDGIGMKHPIGIGVGHLYTVFKKRPDDKSFSIQQ